MGGVGCWLRPRVWCHMPFCTLLNCISGAKELLVSWNWTFLGSPLKWLTLCLLLLNLRAENSVKFLCLYHFKFFSATLLEVLPIVNKWSIQLWRRNGTVEYLKLQGSFWRLKRLFRLILRPSVRLTMRQMKFKCSISFSQLFVPFLHSTVWWDCYR